MNNIITTNTSSSQVINTIDLREFINEARACSGEARMRNDQFIQRVEDELEEELGVCKNIAHPQSGAEMKYYDITIEQAMLVGMRESKGVRRSVLAKLTELKKKSSIPDFSDPILAARAWADAKEAERSALIIANDAIRTKAEIGHRREATAMNTASQAVKKASKLEIALDESLQWSTIRRMEKRHPGMAFSWRILSNASQEVGIPPQKIPDKLFDQVNTYHAEAWLSAYNLDINND